MYIYDTKLILCIQVPLHVGEAVLYIVHINVHIIVAYLHKSYDITN